MPRLGRKLKYGEAAVVTSCRVPVSDWKYCKEKKWDFSTLLYNAIHEKKQNTESGPVARFVRECRRFGLPDSEVHRLLEFQRASDITPTEQIVPEPFLEGKNESTGP